MVFICILWEILTTKTFICRYSRKGVPYITGLYIFLGILFFFVLLFSTRAKVVFVSDGEGTEVTLKIYGIPIRLVPAKDKKIKLSRYSKKNMEKRKLAEAKKSKKKAEKKSAKEEKKKKKKSGSSEKKEKPKDPAALTLVDNVNAVTSALGKFFSRFGKRFRIDLTRIVITVATGDAASTAILYGAVVPATQLLISTVDKFTNLKGLESADIDVRCDFLEKKSTVDIHIAASLRLWHVFDMAFAALHAFLKRRKERRQEKLRALARRRRAAEIITAKLEKKAQAQKSNQET